MLSDSKHEDLKYIMTELVRDCSKYKPITFNDIAFPIVQQIEAKIKIKNVSLRKKARNRIVERQKILKNEDVKDDHSNFVKKQSFYFNKLDREPMNYIQVYQPPRQIKQTTGCYYPSLDIKKNQDKDQQTALHICLLLKKKKNIFKVDQVKRKLRTKEHNKRGSLRQCECCGHIGKHRSKCTHILCQRNCDKCKKSEEKQKIESHQENQRLISMAQELIDDEEVKGPKLMTLQIKIKQEQIQLPKIDVSQDEVVRQKVEEPIDPSQQHIEAIVQTERISEVESKSQISESRRNRSFIRQIGSQKKQEGSPFKIQ